MLQNDEELVVPGGKRDREVSGPAPSSNRDAVHEQRARAHGADREAAVGRRMVQPESSGESHCRRLSEACLRGKTNPPGSGERVVETGPCGQGDPREDEKRGGQGEKAARRLPPGGR